MENILVVDFGKYLLVPDYAREMIRTLGTARIRSSNNSEFRVIADSYIEELVKPLQEHEHYRGIRNIVQEACINANQHGNSENASKFVGMKLSQCRKGYLIQISDQGETRPEDMAKKLENAWKNLVYRDKLEDIKKDLDKFYSAFMCYKGRSDNDVKLTNNLEASIRAMINKTAETDVRKEDYCTNFGLGSARILTASTSREELGISTSLYVVLNRYGKKYLDIFYDSQDSCGFKVNIFLK